MARRGVILTPYFCGLASMCEETVGLPAAAVTVAVALMAAPRSYQTKGADKTLTMMNVPMTTPMRALALAGVSSPGRTCSS